MLGFCPRCEGGNPDCDLCHGTNDQKITSCPQKGLAPDVVQLLGLVNWAKDGHFPGKGGIYDQSQSFKHACEYLWAKENAINAERNKNV